VDLVVTLESRLPEIRKALRREARRIIGETLNDIEADIAVAMGEPKSGQLYRRGERWHQASAPGEPPAIDMGALAASIQQSDVKDDADGVSGMVFTNSEIAPYLEYGTGRAGAAWPLPSRPGDVDYTLSWAGMAPRPYMTPAAERARALFAERFGEIESRLDG
jgi:hypothetical protein